MNQQEKPERVETKPSDAQTSDLPKQIENGATTFRSEDLFRDGKLVSILHAGEVYQLRITKQNRLILNK